MLAAANITDFMADWKPDERNPIFDTNGDGTSVWVHRNGYCIGRFSARMFEINDGSDDARRIAGGLTGNIEAWNVFCKTIVDRFGYEVPRDVTPIRFHDALGIARKSAVSVPLEHITRHFNPLDEDVWHREIVTVEKVESAIARGNFASDFIPLPLREHTYDAWDARRVAYFVVCPDPTPIEIEITSSRGHYEILDGFHRLTAAIIRGDARFNVVINGDEVGTDIAFPDRSETLMFTDETLYASEYERENM